MERLKFNSKSKFWTEDVHSKLVTNRFYQIRVKDQNGNVAQTTTSTCDVLGSVSQQLELNFDNEENLLSINQKFNQKYLLNSKCDDLKQQKFKMKNFENFVKKNKPEVLPEISLVKTEKEESSEEKKEPEVGFIRKYWYFILPAVLLILLGGAPIEEEEGIGTCGLSLIFTLIYFGIILGIIFGRTNTATDLLFKPSQKIPIYYFSHAVSSETKLYTNINKPICRSHCNETERINYHQRSEFSRRVMLVFELSGTNSIIKHSGTNSSLCLGFENFDTISLEYQCFNIFNSSGIRERSTFIISFQYKSTTSIKGRNMILEKIENHPPEEEYNLRPDLNSNDQIYIYLATDNIYDETTTDSLRSEEYLIYIVSILSIFSGLFSSFELIKETIGECIFDTHQTVQENSKYIPLIFSYCCIIFWGISGIITFFVLFYIYDIQTNARNINIFSPDLYDTKFSNGHSPPKIYFSNEWIPNNCKGIEGVSCNLKCDSPSVCDPEKGITSSLFSANELVNHRTSQTKNLTTFYPSICFGYQKIVTNFQYICFQLTKDVENEFQINFKTNAIGEMDYEIFQINGESKTKTMIKLTSPRNFDEQQALNSKFFTYGILPFFTAFTSSLIFGSLLKHLVMLLHDGCMTPCNFCFYQTSKIVEKSESRKLFGYWILTYIAYIFIIICWSTYFIIVLSIYSQRDRYSITKSAALSSFTPDFYEKRINASTGIQMVDLYPFNKTGAPITEHNPFRQMELSTNQNITQVCFNITRIECFMLSQEKSNHFYLSYQIQTLEITKVTFSPLYFMSYNFNLETNQKKYEIRNFSISHKLQPYKDEIYTIFTSDQNELVRVKDNLGGFSVFLVLLSTVSIFSTARIFSFYLRDRILDVIYFLITLGKVNQLNTRNSNLEVVLKEQKELKEEMKKESKLSIEVRNASIIDTFGL
eukprot:gene9591-1793_t